MTYLPTSNDRKIHWRLHLLTPRHLEAFSLITHNRTKLFHIFSKNCHLRTHKLLPNINGRQAFVIAIPKFPVERLDALVATGRDLMDGRETLGRLINELERKQDRAALAFLKEGDIDILRSLLVSNLQRLKALNMIAV